jgi:hypothetical protein
LTDQVVAVHDDVHGHVLRRFPENIHSGRKSLPAKGECAINSSVRLPVGISLSQPTISNRISN